jgi:hypothetical protein
MNNTPHSKHPHLYVVIRIDSHEGLDDAFDEDRLAVTNVFESEEAAASDAARLNELAAKRGSRSRYVTRVGRLKQ